MTTYTRITFKPEGAKRARSVILRNAAIHGLLTTGVQVDTTGDEVAPVGVTERCHVIDNALITKRTKLVMDNHYAELRVAAEEDS